jgi:maltooligosyltrehalose trehalohydrolase
VDEPSDKQPKAILTPQRPLHLGARGEHSAWQWLVWAPKAERLEVHLLESDTYLPLAREVDGYHHGALERAQVGERYFYRIDGTKERPDPASRWQPAGVHGPSALVDPAFEWNDGQWCGLALHDYIIYELHVGTYTRAGTFVALIPRLAALRELGVTAIELMPVAEFPGARNWGYDGVYPFAAHSTYGGPLELKRLVDACHRADLAVVLDVVYNHLGPEGNYLAEYGPYFTDRYRTAWGAAINFDGEHSDHVVRYFVENALQWLDEFHFDALRLDAIHSIIDCNARPFLACLSEAVQELAAGQQRPLYLIGESDLNDVRVVRPRDLGGYALDAQWSDDFHHALHALQTGERNGYYEDFGHVKDLAKAFGNGFVYEGQYSRYRKQRHGDSAAMIEAKRFVVCSQNHDQVGNRMSGDRSATLLTFEALKVSAAAVLWSPFIPLLFMGEEWGETNPFLYFTSHTDADLADAVSTGRKEEFSEFLWQGEVADPQSEATFLASKVSACEGPTEEQRTLHEFYRELIRLRKTTPALRALSMGNVKTEAFEERRLLVLLRWHDDDEVLLLFNFGDQSLRLPMPFPESTWRVLLDSADTAWLGPGSDLPKTIESKPVDPIMMAPRSVALLNRR